MTILRLPMGTTKKWVIYFCNDVPAALWELGKTPEKWVLVFSDKKPKIMAGVYEFTRSAKYVMNDRILIKGRPDTALLRQNASGHDGSFYLLRAARDKLSAKFNPAHDFAVPLHGYVWAEYKG
jgi:hypothetical protein